MDGLPTDFWELPTIAVFGLLVVGYLLWHLSKQTARSEEARKQMAVEQAEERKEAAAERLHYTQFITGLVDDAKMERAQFMKMLDGQINAWRLAQEHSIQGYQRIHKMMQQHQADACKGWENLERLHEQHERNAQLRMEATLAAIDQVGGDVKKLLEQIERGLVE